MKGRPQQVVLIRGPHGSLCRLAVCLPRFARAVLGVCRINRWAKLERIKTWIFSWWAFTGQTIAFGNPGLQTNVGLEE